DWLYDTYGFRRVYLYYTLTWRIKMIIFIKLILIGIISGIILTGVVRAFRLITGCKVDILHYKMDYMPYVNKWSDYWITGILLHYATCIASAVILFSLLVPFTREMTVWPYILVFAAGGGILYFLSALTETPPDWNDASAWFYWTFGHGVFGLAIG